MAEIKESSDKGGAQADPLREAMRRIQDFEGSDSSTLDLSKLGLGPVLRGDWGGWEALPRLGNLGVLNLSGNEITDIPAEGWEAIGRLAGLRALDLAGNVLTRVPEAGWEALRRVAQLLFLNLSHNQITDVPVADWQALGELTNLKYLYAESNTIAIPQ